MHAISFFLSFIRSVSLCFILFLFFFLLPSFLPIFLSAFHLSFVLFCSIIPSFLPSFLPSFPAYLFPSLLYSISSCISASLCVSFSLVVISFNLCRYFLNIFIPSLLLPIFTSKICYRCHLYIWYSFLYNTTCISLFYMLWWTTGLYYAGTWKNLIEYVPCDCCYPSALLLPEWRPSLFQAWPCPWCLSGSAVHAVSRFVAGL